MVIFGLILNFIVFLYYFFVLNKSDAGTWVHENLSKTRSDRAGNVAGSTGQVVHKLFIQII